MKEKETQSIIKRVLVMVVGFRLPADGPRVVQYNGSGSPPLWLSRFTWVVFELGSALAAAVGSSSITCSVKPFLLYVPPPLPLSGRIVINGLLMATIPSPYAVPPSPGNNLYALSAQSPWNPPPRVPHRQESVFSRARAFFNTSDHSRATTWRE